MKSMSENLRDIDRKDEEFRRRDPEGWAIREAKLAWAPVIAAAVLTVPFFIKVAVTLLS